MYTFYAGQKQFLDHLLPIWLSLPDSLRGLFYARSRAFGQLEQLGLEAIYGLPKEAEVVVVASYEDYEVVRPKPVVMVNHGCGQTYGGHEQDSDNPSYSGGRNRDRVVLFLEPGPFAANATRAVTDTKVVEIGVPKLDPYHPPIPYDPPDRPVVTFTFHADVHVCPETRWAEPYFKQAIIDLVRSDPPYEIRGHIHPRFRTWGMKFWGKLGVPFDEDFKDVLDRATLLVADNSSVLYEFASTGRPVACLNAPWYRRNVEHGLRFWSAVPGVQIEDPESLADGIKWALEDDEQVREIRESAVSVAYAYTDGRATEHAVKALIDFAGKQ